MEVKFTFEDGSEAIAHYGVKGMKWKKHLKATDPEYLAQLGLDVQNLLGQTAENVSGTLAGAKDAVSGLADSAKKKAMQTSHDIHMKKLDAKQKAYDARAAAGLTKHDKLSTPGHKYRYNEVDSDGIGLRGYQQTMINGRRRKWKDEYTGNGGKRWTQDDRQAMRDYLDAHPKNASPKVSKEYQQEKEYNSRKNDYRLKTSPSTSSPSKKKQQRGHFTVKNGKTVYVRD